MRKTKLYRTQSILTKMSKAPMTTRMSQSGNTELSHAKLLGLLAPFLVAAALACYGALFCMQPLAFAETDASPLATTSSDYLQPVQIEALAETYENAQAAVEQAEQSVQEHQGRIDELQAEIDSQQDSSSRAIKTAYKMEQDKAGMLDFFLDAQSFDELILEAEYYERINRATIDELDKLRSLMDELALERARLEEAKGEADAQAALAQEALRAAQDERAQKATKARATDGADWHMSEEEFIEEWAPRLDKYLAGSALQGQGANFARSAWRYCIDPRWSAAISTIESGKGAKCIRPHNAWGWGASDEDPVNLASEWSSWEKAIDAHAKGLANGYGYTVTKAGAKTYCPPNWEKWYDTVVSEMKLI